MASITEPPVIPNLSLPVPSRLNPEPFSMLMDRTLLEIPETVDGINITVTWVYDTTQVVHGFAQAAAQSVADAAEQFALAQGEAQHAKESEVSAKVSEVAAKKHLDDTRELVQNFDPTGVLPDGAAVDAPLVVATDQGGVRFSDRTLNEGDDLQGFFGIGENQSPRVKELLPMLHAANLYF